jgi:hypothetical protein
MTSRQKQVVEFLEGLVYGRESIESLNKKISEHFGEKIEVENVSQGRIDNGDEDDELTDWNLMFNSESEETFGYFDIYFLPMRRVGFDGSTMYITEISWEFE